MDTDDGVRPEAGVVVTLVDVGDGTSRLIMDDVRRDPDKSSWTQERFFTHRRWNSKSLDELTLSPDEYRQIGENLVLRLLVLSNRIR